MHKGLWSNGPGPSPPYSGTCVRIHTEKRIVIGWTRNWSYDQTMELSWGQSAPSPPPQQKISKKAAAEARGGGRCHYSIIPCPASWPTLATCPRKGHMGHIETPVGAMNSGGRIEHPLVRIKVEEELSTHCCGVKCRKNRAPVVANLNG